MNINVEKLFVFENYSIRQVLKVLDEGAKGIVFVVDPNHSLVGTITDGDIRRALLKGEDLESKVSNIVHREPIYANIDMNKTQIKDLIIKKAVKVMPIVDNNGKIIDIITINDLLLPEGKENTVVIMAGGLGSRLKELTEEIPKPMLKVGEHPMLQHIINNFKQHGYNKIVMSVNYKSEIIENYFQDGYAYGVKIEYVKENKRLGTAGGIKLAKSFINSPFFVINGDIFTNLNVNKMMKFHVDNNYDITIGVRKYLFQVPYGTLEIDNNMVNKLSEKPKMEFMINGGIYCLNPNVIDLIPNDTYFEITELINICIEKGFRIGSYEIMDYWMDIGKVEDYLKVNEEFHNLIAIDEER